MERTRRRNYALRGHELAISGSTNDAAMSGKKKIGVVLITLFGTVTWIGCEPDRGDTVFACNRRNTLETFDKRIYGTRFIDPG